MKRYISASEKMSGKQYLDLFDGNTEAIKQFISSHESDLDEYGEACIDIDDTYSILIFTDPDDPEYDHVDVVTSLYDGSYHVKFYMDGRVDPYCQI